jgi:SAM-dependent methyltransferase
MSAIDIAKAEPLAAWPRWVSVAVSCPDEGRIVDDSVFYRQMQRPFATFLLRAARLRIYELFCREFPPSPSTRILDIGVSNDVNRHSNFLEKLYPYQHMITCAGVGEGKAVREAFPNVTYVRIEPGRPLPFADQEFDIAYSSAVLEHVGGTAERKRFVKEALRVGRNAFITIPNRWFPVEHHTALPLLHFAPRLFRYALKFTSLDYWSCRDHLDFISASSLERECIDWPGLEAMHCGLPLGPFSSNVAAVWKRTLTG